MDKGILYDQIGQGYNGSRQADRYIVQTLTELLVPSKDGSYLDIGCGTGNYTIALAKNGINFYGVEPSERMLATARQKNTSVEWLRGVAQQIPVADAFFGGAVATLTIHHWTDLKSAFKEINRVLKQGANFIIFTALPEQMQGYWLNNYFPKMMVDSIQQMPSWKTIEAAAHDKGFSISGTNKYFIAKDLQDHFLYSGKHDPEIYLDENIRRGISSFAVLANVKEIQAGLLELKNDIATGDFPGIKHKFDNDKGDYMFITLNKD